ncbi:MAG: HD domain-containing protein [Thermoguttaceae bacterium]|nr:HD domain-containing protein [Thermoguttaceae bacterium]MDW8036691.1 HD domain-containing protein [Thermoguttaceae bacterium]
MRSERLEQQIQFAVVIDKLKSVQRRTWLVDRSRREDAAGHSWHVAAMCMLLAEYAAEPLDLCRALQMALVHDLVEIEAGDTYVYDPEATADKAERERQAADRLFGLLPADQAQHWRSLWEEFERRQTAEARFVAAVDRLQPILNNYYTQGAAWQEHHIRIDQVLERNRPFAEAVPALWECIQQLLADAVRQGMLLPASDFKHSLGGNCTF